MCSKRFSSFVPHAGESLVVGLEQVPVAETRKPHCRASCRQISDCPAKQGFSRAAQTDDAEGVGLASTETEAELREDWEPSLEFDERRKSPTNTAAITAKTPTNTSPVVFFLVTTLVTYVASVYLSSLESERCFLREFITMASPQFPEPPPSMPDTSLEEADRLVAKLVSKKEAWVRTGIPERIRLLERCIEAMTDVASEWVEAAARAKGLAHDSPQVGEEWLGGPVTVVRNLRLLIGALKQNGRPKPPKIRVHDNGQVIAKVFPTSLLEGAMFAGFTAEVWMEPGKHGSQGRIYREKEVGNYGSGGVALVLGAGNVASIGPMDALYKLFVEDEVVILKTNPVNDYLGPYIERGFRPLVADGWMVMVYGGAEVGQHLTQHPSVDSIHITGSDRTHDAIVWGSDPEEQQRRKDSNEPLNTKPISSELGCVTPVWIVPGPWTEEELDYQARHVASMVANNGSFNCNAAKVVITAKHWPLKEAFLAKLHEKLRKFPPRKAYYPGATQRFHAFLEQYPQAEKLQEEHEGVVPWTVLPGIRPSKEEYALTHEAFCGVVAEVELDVMHAPEFLEQATRVSNEEVWGTLSMMMLVHPETQRQFGDDVEKAIEQLRYGGIGVNVWAGVIYGLVTPTWGAFPGHTLHDIQSGRGVVHNTFLFDHPQKSVVRAPFHIKPTPAWFADHKTQARLGKALTKFEANPSWLKAPPVIAAAFKGLSYKGVSHAEHATPFSTAHSSA
jgi:acyl-CoA reductase-like NAD-dependent aldehyde dehydrogenase